MSRFANAQTDDELMAARAARLGRKVAIPTTADRGVNPTAGGAQRTPLDQLPSDIQLTAEQLEMLQRTEPAPTPTPAATPSIDPAIQSQLDAALGRTAGLQRQAEEMRSALAAAEARAAQAERQLQEQQQAAARAELQRRANDFNPFDGIDDAALSQLDDVSKQVLRSVALNAAKHVSAMVPQEDTAQVVARTLAQRDKAELENFVAGTANELRLQELSSDPVFAQFVAEDDSAGLLLNQFVKASDITTARSLAGRVRSMLKRYEKTVAGTKPAHTSTDADLARHLARAPAGGSQGGGNGPAQPLSPEQVRAIRNQAAALTRARKFAEADKLLAKLN